MKKLLIIAILLTLTAAIVAAVAPSKLLPSSGDIKDWKAVKGARIEAKGEELTKIYNGGYKLYLDHGVTEAARDLYQRESDKLVMEITVHVMKSNKAAQEFFEYWRKEYKPKGIDKQKTYSMFVSRKPAAGWMVSGVYLVSAVPSKDGEEIVKDTKAFLHKIRTNIEAAE